MRLLLTLTALVSFAPAGLAAQWDRPGLQPVRIGTPSNCARLSPPLRVVTGSGSHFEVQHGDPCLASSSVDSVTPGGLSAQTLSEVLAGRLAGVSVLRSSGVIGTGSRVRIRGGSGLLFPREPIVLLDGVHVDGSQSSLGIDVGGQAPSRLDDIPLHEVERITILRGPAGTALYGADAAGGVILVTTRRSQGGTPRWETWVDGGVTADATEYPANFGTGPPTYGQDTCTRADAALGSCTPGPLSRWNPLEQASPFRTGLRWTGSASASGGVRGITYYAAGSVGREAGVLAPNDAHRWSGRLNLDATPLRALSVSIRGSHVASGTTFPPGDLAGTGALQAGLGGKT
ncbi:MAG TPA: TonB-dependent receptor plug domain-containing protein, partial [Gemmatimonadaceae bacterium]|nr:TonB-dependent receptor plug domain-containing protein [Gemmatimonadaceae bacterium]